MHRRQFLAKSLYAAVFMPYIFSRCSRPQNPPNIIFIMADDLGYGDLGCYGQKVIQTPNIDRMAQEGIRFTQCYAGSTVCAPSRSVLMTGLHTGHTTVRGNFGKYGVTGLGGGEGRVPLREDDVTVAEVLKTAGYVTGMTGKWGLGEPDTSGEPNGQGFDEWFGYLNQRRAHSYYPAYLWKNKEKMELPGNTDGKRETYSHDLFTEFALDFIKRRQSERFFLYLPYTIPHDIYEIPELEPYVDSSWTADEKVYASMITRMDRDVGKLLDMLKELDIDSNTIVFFCSDNGAARRWKGRFDSSGPLRGNKRDMYEGGIRTPMIVRWPGKIPAGQTSETVWYFADVLPTLAELAGVRPSKGIDGISVLPSLLGREQDLGDRFLYWEFFERGFQQAVRWKDWKAVRLSPGAKLELYDLGKDLGETTDVAEFFPHVVEKIESYLKTARTESENWPVN
ncbi:arylsulfatase [candidate division KSB1 bacterium]|nr:arylsulfatase [candidate division KSB1 bacterium]